MINDAATPGTQPQRFALRPVLARLLVLLGILGLAAEAQDLAADRAALEAPYNDPRTTTISSSFINTRATSGLFVPVILSVSGLNNSYYTSEMTLTNRGSQTATLRYTYRAAAGGGSGTASETVAPGRQKIVPDAIAYLGTLGIPIPGTGNRIGTLQVKVSGSAGVGVTVRTTTRVADGRAGLAYLGLATAGGFEEAVYLCGLRQNAQDRSNVAFQNMGAEGSITLRTTVFSGNPADPSPNMLDDRTLGPGEFYQFNAVLGGKADPASGGYVRVERVGGTAPFYAYGVINDQANSDGSFVFPVTESSLAGVRGQTLPVIIEHPNFSSELIVTNFSDSTKAIDFRFVAKAIGTTDHSARFSLTLAAGAQRIIPEIVEELRRRGIEGVGPAGRTLAGAVFATARRGDLSGVVIGARTGSAGGGGQYSVFYNAVPEGAAFSHTAWIDALQQNRDNRSNLALVNTGEVDAGASVFQLDIHDGETGQLVNTVTGIRVPAQGWRQINGLLGKYAPGTTQGYVRIRKVSGNNPFLAYGVINDGGAPGQRSGDGAYLPATETIHDPGTEPMTDREVLEALYQGTGGPDWIDRSNWLSDAPLSEWFGVQTDRSGRVTSLDLSGNRLSGTIPPALGRLTQLQELNLGGRWDSMSQKSISNQLSGAIPPELASLTQLQQLNLWDNQLSGAIPPELASLTQLQQLYLWGNQLSGAIPPELAGLTQLQSLDLSGNQLSGAIPPELAGLTQLQWLFLGGNQLSGAIPPELAGLTQLQSLSLLGNQLSGAIPPELGQLTQLQVLDLRVNRLSGAIPSELAGLTQLQTLYLGRNQLSGAIPKNLQQLSKLTSLDIGRTNLCVPADATFQAWLDTLSEFTSSGLVCDGTRRVLFLASDYSVREGESITVSVRLIDQTGDPLRSLAIPLTAIGGGGATAADYSGVPESVTVTSRSEASFDVTAVKDESFDDGETIVLGFRRPLPTGITAGDPDTATVRIIDPGTEELTDREALDALYHATGGPDWIDRSNWLSDAPLSEWFGVQTDGSGRVTRLDLSGNRLSGTIPPALGRLTQLQRLFLSDNRLSGPIPPELAGLANLQRLGLPRNQLSGSIPPELAGLANLQRLFLWENQLSGAIPPELGQLANLQDLHLSDNQLSGLIPPELASLTQLQQLNLARNQLSGSIPRELAGLANLQRLGLWENQLSGAIPPELAGLTQLQQLSLSGNQLSGAIPPALASLTNLQELFLERNQLSGAIPPALAQLADLQRLFLGGNQLSGSIPPELGSLGNLQDLYLGGNQLSGSIPRELGQLANLQWLGLPLNQLSGSIPPELGRLANLQRLELSANQLSGAIPPELGQLANLQQLKLFSNQLSGAIPPELGRLANLQRLELSSNQLSGAIPPELGQLANLQQLFLSFNLNLTGTIPPSLQQLPLSTLELMATSVCVPEDSHSRDWLARIDSFLPSGRTCGRPPAEMPSIDVAVFFTPAARRIAGGTTEMEAVIDLMVTETNQAYVDGGVNQQIGLVAREEVPYTEENGSGFLALDRLAGRSDGHMDEIHAIRDRSGADLVHLIAEVTDVGGIANTPGAFGLTCANCDSDVFAHELGHNMGLSHDRYLSRGLLPYSHGYVNQQAFAGGAPESARWRTIMAYGNQCGDAGFFCGTILRFSNPDQTYMGDPLGVPGEDRTAAVDGPADAVRALNLTRHSVAAFRPRASGNQLTMSSTLSQARPTVRTGGGAAPVPGGGLFRAVAPNERGAASRRAGGAIDRATLRRREVRVDIGRLARVSSGGSTALRLNLFDDVVLMGVIERRRPTYSGGYALSGRLGGVAGGSVSLVVNGSVVAGTVRMPGATYRIRPAGAGRHAIIQVDPSQLPQGCQTVSRTTGRER